MKDKDQYCPDCKKVLKYSGSHIFYCKNCHRRYYFLKVPEYKKNKSGNRVRDMMGRLLHSGRYKTQVESWSSSR